MTQYFMHLFDDDQMLLSDLDDDLQTAL